MFGPALAPGWWSLAVLACEGAAGLGDFVDLYVGRRICGVLTRSTGLGRMYPQAQHVSPHTGIRQQQDW